MCSIRALVGGIVLFHNQQNRQHPHGTSPALRDVINTFISSALLGEGKDRNSASNNEGSRREIISLGNRQTPVVAEWLDGSTITTKSISADEEQRVNWIVLAVYPEVALRKLHGVGALLSSLLKRYALYYDHHYKQQQTSTEPQPQQCDQDLQFWNSQLFVPPTDGFSNACDSMVRRFQEQLHAASASSSSISSLEKQRQNTTTNNKSNKSNKSNKKGKELRVWHDGNHKVTKAALEELDMSKDKNSTLPGEQAPNGIMEDTRAIAEAKAAYMPDPDCDKPDWEDESLDDFDITWNMGNGQNSADEEKDDAEVPSSRIRSFFSNLLSPNRPLSKSDLDPPLKQMQQQLASKNVAPNTAQTICDVVRQQLEGEEQKDEKHPFFSHLWFLFLFEQNRLRHISFDDNWGNETL